MFCFTVLRCKKLMKQEVNKVSSMLNGSVFSGGGGGMGSLGSPKLKNVPAKYQSSKHKLHVTTSLSFQDLQSEAGQGVESVEENQSATMKRQKVTSLLIWSAVRL